eukprot:TRINITY_DN5252_c0_g1_i3.p1 TRINITY_DN5252_c0_g1~~TRINITY_DN5252_c0_g1_i3.p1  ORF type:complete len:688 (+),score=199.63 TRINITY_DN5252_c0_g1_i3:37-2100(+)
MSNTGNTNAPSSFFSFITAPFQAISRRLNFDLQNFSRSRLIFFSVFFSVALVFLSLWGGRKKPKRRTSSQNKSDDTLTPRDVDNEYTEESSDEIEQLRLQEKRKIDFDEIVSNSLKYLKESKSQSYIAPKQVVIEEPKKKNNDVELVADGFDVINPEFVDIKPGVENSDEAEEKREEKLLIEAEKDVEYIKNKSLHLSLTILNGAVLHGLTKESLPLWRKKHLWLDEFLYSFKHEEIGLEVTLTSFCWLSLDKLMNLFIKSYVHRRRKLGFSNLTAFDEKTLGEHFESWRLDRRLGAQLVANISSLARLKEQNGLTDANLNEFIVFMFRKIPKEHWFALSDILADLSESKQRKKLLKRERYRELELMFRRVWKGLRIAERTVVTVKTVIAEQAPVRSETKSHKKAKDLLIATSSSAPIQSPVERRSPVQSPSSTPRTSPLPSSSSSPFVSPVLPSTAALLETYPQEDGLENQQTFSARIHRFTYNSTSIITRSVIGFVSAEWDFLFDDIERRFALLQIKYPFLNEAVHSSKDHSDNQIHSNHQLQSQHQHHGSDSVINNNNSNKLSQMSLPKLSTHVTNSDQMIELDDENKYIITLHFALKNIEKDNLFLLISDLLSAFREKLQLVFEGILRRSIGTLLAVDLKLHSDRLVHVQIFFNQNNSQYFQIIQLIYFLVLTTFVQNPVWYC